MEKIIFEDLPSTNTPINGTNLNLIQDNMENDLYYKAGDTETISRWYGGGTIISNAKRIIFSIPLSKKIDNVTPEIISGKISVRGINGNIIAGGSMTDASSFGLHKDGEVLSIEANYESLENATNYTPVGIEISSLQISFL